MQQEIHNIVDQITDEAQLMVLHTVALPIHRQPDDIWRDLSEDQRKELREAYEESFDEAKWIRHEDVVKKYKSNSLTPG